MKIGIHLRKSSFSEKWVHYCEEKGIDWKPVDCYRSDIMQQLEDCDALMWHFSHISPRDFLMARQVLYAAKKAGKVVFPDFDASWHFDDKVGQKYLLEAIGAPLVPTWVFYDKKDALKWIGETGFPKVFKLRSGSAASNVKLVENLRSARRLVRKAFGRGIRMYEPWGSVKERIRKYRLGMTSMQDVAHGLGRILIPPLYARMMGREKGYVYFQEYQKNNTYDTRLIVIGERCFGVKRFNRKNDFRASGSGLLAYEEHVFDKEMIQIAFQAAEKIGSNVLALDFLYDHNRDPVITEISYAFPTGSFTDDCQGYWDKEIKWHEGKVNAPGMMIEQILKNIRASRGQS
jgi:glutathione synthase/RimK-type ligase-like ATP-grasp enzyme